MSFDKPVKPLSNLDRVIILQTETGQEFNQLQDLEIHHFGNNRNTTMLEKFKTVINPIGSFDNKYDDYLLYLYDQQQEPDVPAGGPGGIGSPIGLLIALTQGSAPPESPPPPVTITNGTLITTVPGITYAQDIN